MALFLVEKPEIKIGKIKLREEQLGDRVDKPDDTKPISISDQDF